MFWRDSQLPYIIESRRACDSRVCYKSHSHPSFSIGVIDKGQSIFQAQTFGQHHLKAGQIILIPAHQQHSCNPRPNQAWSYQMLHLDLDWLNQVHQEIVTTKKHGLQQVIILDHPQLYTAFCQFNILLFSTQDIFIKQITLYQLLEQIFNSEPELTLEKPQLNHEPFLLTHCYHEIAQHEGLLSLEDLMQMTQLSSFQIIRLFKAYTGFTPHHFQLNLRINRARELLQQQLRLTDITYQLGFADQSHFQRTFKSFVGITPQQYQNALAH